MKIQIVYLNPEDDVHSTREMLSWVKAPRALLVWPDRGKVLPHQLDLVLLKRFSQQRKIEIGLLTFDTEIRMRAAELGIPVFDSMDELPEVTWGADQQIEGASSQEKDFNKEGLGNEGPKESSRSWFEKLSKTRKRVFISTMAIVGLLFIFLFLPSTTVYVSPNRIATMMEFEVFPITEDSSGREFGYLSMETVILEISGARTEETSGISNIPLSRAEGSVVFTNLSSQPITVPVDTIVRTSAEGGTRFRTTKQVHIPGELGIEVVVPIEALTLGQSGNVRVNAISYIESSLGLILKVTNPNPIRGGSDEVRRMVTEEDLQQVKQKLIEELMHRAESEMKDVISADQILVEGHIDVRKIYESHFSHLGNDLSDTVSLEMSLEFVAGSLSRSDLLSVALQSLSDEFPHGFQIVQDSLEFRSAEYISRSDSVEERILIAVQIESFQNVDIEKSRVIIRGQTTSDATRLLFEYLELEVVPEIEMKPDWFPILPLLNERIDFRNIGEEPG